jgi:hypothetical protein
MNFLFESIFNLQDAESYFYILVFVGFIHIILLNFDFFDLVLRLPALQDLKIISSTNLICKEMSLHIYLRGLI